MNLLSGLRGSVFGRWTVLDNNPASKLLCRCACGEERHVNSYTLREGVSKSCGCGPKRPNKGRVGTKEYRTWKRMRQRCNNPKVERWPGYGGRGIKIAERWDDYENFLLDMGRAPSPKHSIERKDVDGDYCPENCVWATPNEQAVNTQKRKDNTSGYTGVFKNGNTWCARLNWLGAVHWVGNYNSPKEAAQARNDYLDIHKLPHKRDVLNG